MHMTPLTSIGCLVSALLLAGCPGDDDSTETGATASATDTQTSTSANTGDTTVTEDTSATSADSSATNTGGTADSGAQTEGTMDSGGETEAETETGPACVPIGGDCGGHPVGCCGDATCSESQATFGECVPIERCVELGGKCVEGACCEALSCDPRSSQCVRAM